MTAAKKRFLVFGLMALAILLVAVLAPVIATHDPNSSVLAAVWWKRSSCVLPT